MQAVPTQEIIHELHDVGILASQLSKNIVETVLKEPNLNTEDATLKLVTKTLEKTNPLSCLSESGPLGTEYKGSHFTRKDLMLLSQLNIF